MPAFQTVWSIDVGRSSLKAVKMHRERNSIEIVAVDKVDFPVSSSGFDGITGPKQAIETFASRNDVDCPVVVAHPGHSAFSRFIQLPPVDAKKLEEMIGYEAQQQIPFQIDEVIWDHHVCDTPDSVEKEVGIFAVRKEAIADFLTDFQDHGIQPDHISIGYIGLLNYVGYDLNPDTPTVAIDIGSEHTYLVIVDSGRFWVRNLGIAGNDVTTALADKFKLSFDEAEKLKRTASQNKEQMAKIFSVIQPILKDLVNEIHRSVGFYKSQAGEVQFSDVYLYGNGARLIGIQKFLSEHLRFNVQVENRFRRIRVSREANVALLQRDFPAFAPVVGDGVLALGEGNCEVNLLPQEIQQEISFRHKQKAVLGAAASLLLVPLILGLSYSQKASSARAANENAAIAAELSEHSSELSDIRSEIADASDRARQLLDYGVERGTPLAALDEAGVVFSSFVNDEEIVAEAVDDPSRASVETDLSVQIDELNAERAWIVGFETTRVQLDDEGNIVKKVSKDSKPVQIAYEVALTCMIMPRESGIASTELITNRILTPLEEKLRERFGREIPIELETNLAETADELYVQHPRLKESGSARGVENPLGLQKFVLRWVQHEKVTEKPSDTPEGDE